MYVVTFLIQQATPTPVNTQIPPVVSAVAASLSLLVSSIALAVSIKTMVTNKKIAKRQGVFNLHMAWQGVEDIIPSELIGPAILKAANALDLTASLWNHDVIDKNILCQSYWITYRDIYDTLYGITDLVPGKPMRCKDLLTPEITRAYNQMKNRCGEVKQTTV